MKKRYCVIGLGNFGYHVAATLFAEGHEVVAIDSDKDKVQAVKDVTTCAILGDAANKDFLDAQGVREMSAAVVSTGDRSHLATLITLFLKELKVPRIFVKAINEDHGRILERVGATDVIFPEKDMAKKVALSLASPNVLDYIPLAEDYSIFETEPPRRFIGKTFIDLQLRQKYQITVIAVKDMLTGRFVMTPPPDYLVKDSDMLVMLGRTADVDKALKERS